MTKRDDDSDSALWKEYRRAQRQRRAARLPARTEQILGLSSFGLTVRRITDYQYRINEALDLYPVHRRFHNFRTQERGTYSAGGRAFESFVRRQLAAARKWVESGGNAEL